MTSALRLVLAFASFCLTVALLTGSALAQAPGEAGKPPIPDEEAGKPPVADEASKPPVADGASKPPVADGAADTPVVDSSKASGTPENTTGGTASAPPVAAGYPTTPQGYPTATSPDGVKVTTQQATRLRALEGDLNVLASRNEGRILNGSLSIAMGAAFITLGVFVDDAWLRTLLVLTGGVATARGVVELTVLPDAEKPALEFAHMPMLSSAQVVARLSYGEEALSELARRTRTARLIDGSLTMLAGAGYVPIYTFARHREDKDWRFGDDASDYIMAVFSGLTFVTGLVTVILKSPAERRMIAYGKLRDRLAAEERVTSTRRFPEIAPYANRHGAGLAAHMRF